ncbi:MAG: hypothetical protein ACK5S6_01630 [bacterium]
MAKTYKPTSGMATAAKRALAWKSEGKAGGTLVGLARANQLKDRDPLSASTVLRMYSFFSRHEPDKQATGFNSGEDGFPSKGRVAWDLWGGDGGYSWSTAKRNQIMRERESKALKLVNITKSIVPDMLLKVAADMIEQYAREYIPEENTAFGQYMYHAQLLRNGHLEVYLLDLHLVAEEYRDILVTVFSELDITEPGGDDDTVDDDEAQ